jgi:chemotaxis protein MotB
MPLMREPVMLPAKLRVQDGVMRGGSNTSGKSMEQTRTQLQHMADEVQKALGGLIESNEIVVRASDTRLEIEIRTDILFTSGSATVSDAAMPVLTRLAGILAPFPNTLRIEGYTDDVPIHTLAFASNWELSAARAASVVHLFMERGVDPKRMSVAGFGEYRPVAPNDSADGRNHNRRVVIVVLADPANQLPAALAPDTASASDSASAAGADGTAESAMAAATPDAAPIVTQTTAEPPPAAQPEAAGTPP